MSDELIVTVEGLKPGDVWPLPPDQIDDLAATLIQLMIQHKQEKQNHESMALTTASTKALS